MDDMMFGGTFDADIHDVAHWERQAWAWSLQYPLTSYPRQTWPALPNSEAAHHARQWLNLLTVRDAAFLHAVGIDPLG